MGNKEEKCLLIRFVHSMRCHQQTNSSQLSCVKKMGVCQIEQYPTFTV